MLFVFHVMVRITYLGNSGIWVVGLGCKEMSFFRVEWGKQKIKKLSKDNSESFLLHMRPIKFIGHSKQIVILHPRAAP